MSTLGTNYLTLADWAKRQDPDNKAARIIELLMQSNEILSEMLWKEGNLPTGERTTVRTGLPTVAWRLINAGVAPSKSTTAQIDESVGLLEAWSAVDCELAKLNSDVAAFRLSEASAFIEAMNQEMASTLFYGNSGLAPEEITGFATRYSSLSAANGQNIVSGGGTDAGNQSSIWLICWGANTVFGIYPKGSQAGLEHKDLGEETVNDANGVAGALMRAYRDQFVWKAGIALKDWRYVVRIANIDISNLVAKSSAADLFDLMIKAMHRIPNLNMGKCAWYMNRTVHQMLDIQTRDDVQTGGQLKYELVEGKPVLSFRGIPIRTTDALTETENQVS